MDNRPNPAMTNAAQGGNFALPFYLLLSLVLAALAAWIVGTVAYLRSEAVYGVLFIGGMAAHVGLHWLAYRHRWRLAGVLVYQSIQTCLICGLAVLSGDRALVFGLCLVMVGETAGVLAVRPAAALAMVIWHSLLSIACVVGLSGFGSVTRSWIIANLACTMVMLAFIWMYRVQERLRRRLVVSAAEIEQLTALNERQRLARDLHDLLSQGLAGLILRLEATESHLEHQRAEKALSVIREAKIQARGCLDDARGIIQTLRQESGGGLATGIERAVAAFHAETGLACPLHCELSAEPKPLVTEGLIGVAKESLCNVAAHAQATRVSVKLQDSGTELRLTVTDDGRGFDTSLVPPGHYGLLGMRERARLCGGKLEIRSVLGGGTTVACVVPREQR